jgi:hypothetical protein
MNQDKNLLDIEDNYQRNGIVNIEANNRYEGGISEAALSSGDEGTFFFFPIIFHKIL